MNTGLKWHFDYYRQRILNMRLSDRRLLYAKWEQMQLQRLLRHLDVDCVFDIGANEGQYARMLRRSALYKGLIISFEPIPACAAVARNHAKTDSQWVIEELAVSTQNGEQSFNVMHESQFSSFSAPNHKDVGAFAGRNDVAQSISVQSRTLSTVLHEMKQRYGFKRPFLKMDTQGYDIHIVRAGREVMPQFVGLQSELAVVKLYESSMDYREAIREYESLGFTLSALVPNNEGHFPRLLEIDCIMIRSDVAQTQ
jgi:FkbM family methyltransferase